MVEKREAISIPIVTIVFSFLLMMVVGWNQVFNYNCCVALDLVIALKTKFLSVTA